MIINIHRGQNQIGGSIIEISDDKTRLFFDIGINLDENGKLVNMPTAQDIGALSGDDIKIEKINGGYI